MKNVFEVSRHIAKKISGKIKYGELIESRLSQQIPTQFKRTHPLKNPFIHDIGNLMEYCRFPSNDAEFMVWYSKIPEDNTRKNVNNCFETRITSKNTFTEKESKELENNIKTRNLQEDRKKILITKLLRRLIFT